MKNILFPSYVDKTNINAQSLNGKALIENFKLNKFTLTAFKYGPLPNELRNKTNFRSIQLWPWRFWRFRLFLEYFKPYDLIIYPNGDDGEYRALKLLEKFGKKRILITTIEGLSGDESREKEYSNEFGHPVFCQRSKKDSYIKGDYLHEKAQLIIAISPFLKKIAEYRFGEKVVFLPLGVDTKLFHPNFKKNNTVTRVISSGSLKNGKRPEIFLQFAEAHQNASFTWFGDGPMRASLIQQAKDRKLNNIFFPGSMNRFDLAQHMRNANIFILPSLTEGVPKVTHEAAASGLAIIINGFYEAPTVVHENNGYVVWNDEDMSKRLGELIIHPELTKQMGEVSRKMAIHWDWSIITPMWEKIIIDQLNKLVD